MWEETKASCAILRAIQTCALVFYGSFPLFSQVAIDKWTADRGLPINTVRGICQTADGYLWLATMDGLVRFDGVRFTTFNRSNTEGIRGNRFDWMTRTADDDVWAGTESSGITRYHHGRFTTYTVRDGLPSENISGVQEDERGNVWVLVRGQVFRWRATDSRFVPLEDQRFKYSYSLSTFGSGVFYRIGPRAIYLFLQGGQVSYPLPGHWPANETRAAWLDAQKHLWIGTTSGKRARFTDGRWSVAPRTAYGNVRCTAKAQDFSSYYRDREGTVWVSNTELDQSWRWINYLLLPPGSESPKIAFNTLFEDREGNIWLATDAGGLCRVRKQTIKVYSTEHGLPARNVYPIYEDKAGIVWIGTWTGGLCRFHGRSCRNFTTADGLASNRIDAIGEGADGRLWVSVAPGRLYCIRGERVEPCGHGLLPEEFEIKAIHQDSAGGMLLGAEEGLFRWDGTSRTLLTKKDGLASDDVHVILYGRKGNLWIGGYGGLSSLKDGRMRAWTERDGLPSNTIRALYEDVDGVLWIGTYDGGLGRFEEGRFTRYTDRDGLFNNGVFQILEDRRGNLWMSCNRGIYYVSKDQLNDFAAGRIRRITSVAYGRQDGMRNVECNGGLGQNGFKARDGKLWFATQDGVAVVDPEALAGNPPPPPVVVESTAVDHMPVSHRSPLQIEPGRENLEIQYTALSFIDSERIQFRYQLRGLDRDWVNAGTRRTAYYSHLPPGRYSFEVMAAHIGGSWSEAGPTLAVVVLPPYYRTWSFALLIVTLAAGSLWFVWRHRLKAFELERAAQQAFSRQLIARQEHERKRIAAELHDSLGQRLVIVKNLALLVLQNRGAASALNDSQREQVEEISAEVSGAVREVKEIAYNLRPFRLDRLGLTAAVRSLVETACAASSTAFSAELSDLHGFFPRDAEINFYRVVQESINNVLKHAGAKHALVRIERSGTRLTLTVQDDGKGFDPDFSQAERLRQGFGLTGMSERASLLGGKATIRSSPGQGTIVTVDLDRGKMKNEQ